MSSNNCELTGITKLKELTEQLNLRDQNLKESNLFLAKLPFPIFAFDKNQTIIYANEEAKHGMLPKKRKLETVGCFTPREVDVISNCIQTAFDENRVCTKSEIVNNRNLIVKSIDYYGIVRYVLVIIQGK